MGDSAPVTLITGGATRVGAAIACELADAGFDIVIHYNRSEEAACETAAKIEAKDRKAWRVRANLLDSDAPTRIIEYVKSEAGRLDVLINNASIFEPDPAGSFSPDHWHRMFQINAVAPGALIEAAEGLLMGAPRGGVINLCDISADRPWPHYSAYCASKAALVNLTRSYALRFAPRVLVNGVAPGIAIFPDDFDEEMRRKLVAKVPMQREGSAEEVAATVRFLAKHAGYMTGQIIRVDGGRSIA
ncbi:MAG: SDR family oxidoreductase [Planctomycetes bacterium]|nr:SDR family oxidoreductase [Planctomycetota bacterium]